MCFERCLRQWVLILKWPLSLFMLLPVTAALACSTMMLGLPERPIVAYSFDFAATGSGFLLINPQGAIRHSIMGNNPAEWMARYGSVTFNQIGPGMPAAGMNTAGLVVSLMWNNDAVYSQDIDAPIVNELEFIQRLLDTSASVDQVLEVLQNIHIQGMIPIHYFIADRMGRTAAVTPTVAGFRIHTGDDMPVPALTNTSYAKLMEEIAFFKGFGGEQALPSGDRLDNPNSLERFAIAASASRRLNPGLTMEKALGMLNAVANRDTRWQIVFDPVMQRIAFQMVDQQEIHIFDMLNLEFRCFDHPLSADLNEISGKDFPVDFVPMSVAKISRVARTVLGSFSDTSGLGPEISDGLIQGLLESVTCAPRQRRNSSHN